MGGGQPNLDNACILGVSGPATPPLAGKLFQQIEANVRQGCDVCSFQLPAVTLAAVYIVFVFLFKKIVFPVFMFVFAFCILVLILEFCIFAFE